MSKPTPGPRTLPRTALVGLLLVALFLTLGAAPASAQIAGPYPNAGAFFPPGYNPANYAANYNPYVVISDDNWRAEYSMSQGDIQAFLNTQPTVLQDYVCAEGGPNGLHSQIMKPAAQIIAEAAQYWHVNPKLIIATLNKEQSLITAANHDGYGGDRSGEGGVYPPPSGVTLGTGYHLKYAMGVGCFRNADGSVTDPHPGFGDQVWTGAQKLAAAPTDPNSPYHWTPGKMKLVYSYPSAAQVYIIPGNQPTWNAYTYTPYFPQISVWQQYSTFFGDPLAFPGIAPVYRFYNMKNGSHFYTRSEAERYNVVANYSSVYRFEGAAYSVDTTSPAMTASLYRFYNRRNGTHFYTASEQEKNNVIAMYSSTYTFEGTAYLVSSSPEGCVPVHRFYNVRSRSHFYTISEDEKNTVIATWPTIFRYEGVAYYVALSH